MCKNKYYCQKCGERLIEVKSDKYNTKTGKKEKKFECPRYNDSVKEYASNVRSLLYPFDWDLTRFAIRGIPEYKVFLARLYSMNYEMHTVIYESELNADTD